MRAEKYAIEHAWYFQEGAVSYMMTTNRTGYRWEADYLGRGQVMVSSTQSDKRAVYIPHRGIGYDT